MASPIDICNHGLSLVGAKTIESLDENSPEARICKLIWPLIRDAKLREHPWNCALTRVTFNRLVETPAYGFSYYFQLPANCLHVHEVEPEQLFEVEGRKIAADSSTLSGKIIFQQTDASRYDAQLSFSLGHLMGGQLAFPLASDKSLGLELTAKGESLLADAKASDALEGRTQNRRNNRFISAKYGR